MTIDRNAVEVLALEMLDELGSPDLLNFRGIARRLGCAHTSLYHHYASFDDLLGQVALRAIEGMRTQVVPTVGTFPERLEAFLGGLFDYALRHRGLYLFLWVDHRVPSRIDPYRGLPRPETLFAADLAGHFGVGEGSPRVTDAAALLHSYFHGEVIKVLGGRTPDARPVVKERILRNTKYLLEVWK